MNSFFAVILSVFGLVNASDSNIESYLKTMASGAKCEPLACVLHTSVSNHWKQAVPFIEKKMIVDVSSSEDKARKEKSFQLTALGLKHFSKH